MDDIIENFGSDPAPEDFDELWSRLSKDEEKFDYRRPFQKDILQKYRDEEEEDITICLPTGTGKTLIALLICRYEQLNKDYKTLYLCPTKQLCKQVEESGKELGIPVVPLYGNYDEEVKHEDEMEYIRSEAVGVATYWSLFNSNPKIDSPDLIIFDDVHAGKNAVLNPWKLEITDSNPELLKEVKEKISKYESEEFLSEVYNDSTYLLPHRKWMLVQDSLKPLFERKNLKEKGIYAWDNLKADLGKCFCFIDRGEVIIRPIVPPTFDHSHFSTAKKRIYLSATLDKWGQIERTVGIDEAKRLEEETDPPGERLILDLESIYTGDNTAKKARKFINQLEKVLILCPSNYEKSNLREDLEESNYIDHKIFAGDKVEQELKRFRVADDESILIVSNRYTGLDIDEEVCDGLMLYKLPSAIGPKEKFTANTWELSKLAQARARQRIHQGMGRCTRGSTDQVVVGLLGKDLTKFLGNQDVRKALPELIRTELELSDNIDNPEDASKFISTFKDKSEDWDEIKGKLETEKSNKQPPTLPDEEELEINREVGKYGRLIWEGNFSDASKLASANAEKLEGMDSKESAASWFYFASFACDLEEYISQGKLKSTKGGEYQGRAKYTVKGVKWFGEELQEIDKTSISFDEERIDNIKEYSEKSKLQQKRSDITTKLDGSSDNSFKRAIEELGRALGFNVVRPNRDGEPDGIWAKGDKAFIIWEAKTEKKQRGSIHMSDARQITNHKEEVSSNEGLDVSDAYTVCVTHVEEIHDNAEAHANEFYVTTEESIIELTQSWFDMLLSLRDLDLSSENVISRKIYEGQNGDELIRSLDIQLADEKLNTG